MARGNIKKHWHDLGLVCFIVARFRRYVNFWKNRLGERIRGHQAPESHRRGRIGEDAAALYLKHCGLKLLLRNVCVGPGEIDLIFRHEKSLVFVEVKTRQYDAQERPSEAVDRRKRRVMIQSADAYLKELSRPQIHVRFDIVEVMLEGDRVDEVRWLPSAFSDWRG